MSTSTTKSLLRHLGGVPVASEGIGPIQGSVFFVKPSSGDDAKDGKSIENAFKTLDAALDACTANKNDTVFLIAESNTAANTTDYQSATLDWSKDLCHLIGVNSGPLVSHRSRVAFASTYDTASNLFTLSANGCYIANISFFAGVAGTNPTGCMKVTGSRNRVENCQIAGIGHANNDIAGAYSLKLDAAAENVFVNCAIGLDTIARGTAANSGVLVDTAAVRNLFDRCLFTAFLEHASNHVHVRLNDATAIDRWLWFRDCLFYYESENYAAGGTGVMKIPALTQGKVVVQNCMAFSDKSSVTVKWDVNDADKILLFNSPTPAADTAGVGRWV